jgi:uncharacterized membrane-anchored protein YjiN (DUF445 family)
MKRTATALLVGAAGVYAAATAWGGPHPVWGYVTAFSEAAMVGAIADWFAVSALFRHPLGLPIPHTAIIPRNKERIGRNLADFICNNFLSTPQLLAKIRAFDPGRRLADWLAEPAHAEQVGTHLVAAAQYGLRALDDRRLQAFLHDTLSAGLRQLDLSHAVGQLLDAATSERRHQAVLDELLLQLAELLQKEGLQETLADAIAKEVKGLRYVGLDQVAARLATRKIVAATARTIVDMAENPDHVLRHRFDEVVHGFTERLQHDPGFQRRGQAIRDELLDHPAFREYLQGLWRKLQDWLQTDMGREDSSIRTHISAMALTLGQRLQQDDTMQAWINEQVLAAAPLPIERYREDIRAYITQRIGDWNAQEMTDELERNIGKDLQFIRINGTLVGGLVGLAIHAVTQLARNM